MQIITRFSASPLEIRKDERNRESKTLQKTQAAHALTLAPKAPKTSRMMPRLSVLRARTMLDAQIKTVVT